ncbi:eCIS core domain-containing protein [Hwangdonia lutea]|uniref:DUF4157 domain-containing protein n=1 Tax=Hwangdonia lutea TaxID=3075823 RepID=A0AA97HQX4_9FLAO|nr:DUF4157 domain-containing protein [Hwangdonia sp. SCSIO 19198]WOD42843.1 DUF4157 domain-containing protein [Hwangdonia sp. SCSIO 19198]
MKMFRRYKERATDTSHTPFIQPKLNIGKPGDKYEVEADAMANKVVNGKGGDAIQKAEGTEEELQQKPLAASISPLVQMQSEETSEEENIQAKCTDCEQEEQVQRVEEEEESLQMKTEQSSSAKSNIEASLKKSKGSGQKLSQPVKQTMENGFGADFSHVNIHTDNQAIQMSKRIKAQAFTHGNDIYFNKGKYNPSSRSGKHLLAHELTHTIQQKGMVQKKIQKLSYGSGSAPHTDYSAVPKNEKGRIDKAMGIVKKIANSQKKYPVCHNFFKDNTPSGTSKTLKEVFDRTHVWFDKDNSVYGSSIVPNDLAYTSETWRWGRWSLAGMFIHEMMHLAGQDNEATNDLATKKCRLPDIQEFKDIRK